MIRAAATGALVVAVVATVLLVRLSLSDAPEATGAVVPACREVDTTDIDERVVCATRSATLTIAREGAAVPIGRTNARVLRSRVANRRLVVRLRLRRAARAGLSLVGEGQVYVRVDGDRIDPEPLFGARERSRTETVSLRFRLTKRQARRLRRGKARAELAIVPYGQLGSENPTRLGVVRLETARRT